jgi:hypothetical protein
MVPGAGSDPTKGPMKAKKGLTLEEISKMPFKEASRRLSEIEELMKTEG